MDDTSLEVLLKIVKKRWTPKGRKLGLGDWETVKSIPVDGESKAMECKAAQAIEVQLQEEPVKGSGWK